MLTRNQPSNATYPLQIATPERHWQRRLPTSILIPCTQHHLMWPIPCWTPVYAPKPRYGLPHGLPVCLQPRTNPRRSSLRRTSTSQHHRPAAKTTYHAAQGTSHHHMQVDCTSHPYFSYRMPRAAAGGLAPQLDRCDHPWYAPHATPGFPEPKRAPCMCVPLQGSAPWRSSTDGQPCARGTCPLTRAPPHTQPPHTQPPHTGGPQGCEGVASTRRKVAAAARRSSSSRSEGRMSHSRGEPRRRRSGAQYLGQGAGARRWEGVPVSKNNGLGRG